MVNDNKDKAVFSVQRIENGFLVEYPNIVGDTITSHRTTIQEVLDLIKSILGYTIEE
jgi:hypothetical protein